MEWAGGAELARRAASVSFSLPIGTFRPFADFGMKSVAALLIIALTVVNYLGVLRAVGAHSCRYSRSRRVCVRLTGISVAFGSFIFRR